MEDDVVENETKYEQDHEKGGSQHIPFDDLVKDRLSSYFNEDLRSSELVFQIRLVLNNRVEKEEGNCERENHVCI